MLYFAAESLEHQWQRQPRTIKKAAQSQNREKQPTQKACNFQALRFTCIVASALKRDEHGFSRGRRKKWYTHDINHIQISKIGE
ncbi:hypothetical protein BPOR_0211g00070 [Botrytis porri]|uniref:Uncharacterized protein n=1 Tax=Botrytis porri TaxID=87229 RepID=A0A4Z1KQ12_9HELO|nr:hypothetical protein BPOR_0211g00070 [Botrytis porri]